MTTRPEIAPQSLLNSEGVSFERLSKKLPFLLWPNEFWATAMYISQHPRGILTQHLADQTSVQKISDMSRGVFPSDSGSIGTVHSLRSASSQGHIVAKESVEQINALRDNSTGCCGGRDEEVIGSDSSQTDELVRLLQADADEDPIFEWRLPTEEELDQSASQDVIDFEKGQHYFIIQGPLYLPHSQAMEKAGVSRRATQIMFEEDPDGKAKLLDYLKRFDQVYIWIGHGAKQGIKDMKKLKEKIKKQLADVVDCKRVLAVYGGDPYKSGNQDIAHVLHWMYIELGISVLAVQCVDYADDYTAIPRMKEYQHISAAYFYETDRDSSGAIVYGGLHPERTNDDGEPDLAGQSRVCFDPDFLRQVHGVIAIGGGGITRDDVAICMRKKVPLFYMRSEVRDIQSKSRYGITDEFVRRHDIPVEKWTQPRRLPADEERDVIVSPKSADSKVDAEMVILTNKTSSEMKATEDGRWVSALTPRTKLRQRQRSVMGALKGSDGPGRASSLLRVWDDAKNQKIWIPAHNKWDLLAYLMDSYYPELFAGIRQHQYIFQAYWDSLFFEFMLADLIFSDPAKTSHFMKTCMYYLTWAYDERRLGVYGGNDNDRDIRLGQALHHADPFIRQTFTATKPIDVPITIDDIKMSPKMGNIALLCLCQSDLVGVISYETAVSSVFAGRKSLLDCDTITLVLLYIFPALIIANLIWDINDYLLLPINVVADLEKDADFNVSIIMVPLSIACYLYYMVLLWNSDMNHSYWIRRFAVPPASSNLVAFNPFLVVFEFLTVVFGATLAPAHYRWNTTFDPAMGEIEMLANLSSAKDRNGCGEGCHMFVTLFGSDYIHTKARPLQEERPNCLSFRPRSRKTPQPAKLGVRRLRKVLRQYLGQKFTSKPDFEKSTTALLEALVGQGVTQEKQLVNIFEACNTSREFWHFMREVLPSFTLAQAMSLFEQWIQENPRGPSADDLKIDGVDDVEPPLPPQPGSDDAKVSLKSPKTLKKGGRARSKKRGVRF